MPYFGGRLTRQRQKFRWLSRSQTPAVDISDSLLTAEDGSRTSLGWDYRTTFAQPTTTEKPRRSVRRSLKRLMRFNPLRQNPISASAARASNQSSFVSFFRRRSTTSSFPADDLESPPSIPPLPPSFAFPQPPQAASLRFSSDSSQHETLGSSQSPELPEEVLPPAFHRSWCYRNSGITVASEESETRSFKSVPGWVKFHYPRKSQSDREVSRFSSSPLPAPQAIAPSTWLKAKIFRRSPSTTTSASKEETNSTSNNFEESTSAESPVAGGSGLKPTKDGPRTSCESFDSLGVERQEPWQS